ncbi:MAG: 2-hydroxyacid dehydrogenase [Gammaproteobacteria bacterium]
MKLPLPVVCVTFNSTDSRPVIESTLADVASVVYLADIDPSDESSRRHQLLESNIVFCLQPGRELPTGILKQMPHLDLVQSLSSGVDHIDFSDFPDRVAVAGNSGAYAEPIAEHLLAMVLALTKKLPQRHQSMRTGEFDQLSTTGTLRGKVAGILGYGGIGQESARLFRGLGMTIQAINSSGSPQTDVEFTGTLEDLEQVMRASDVFVISMPLTQDTENLIGAEQLNWLKPDAILANVARGEIVQQKPLYDFLRNNPAASAAIDAWWVEPFRHGEFRLDYPFLDLDNLLGSPHNSPRSPGTDLVAATKAAENIKRFLTAGRVTGLVNTKRSLFSG